MNTEDNKQNAACQVERPVWEQLDYQHDAIIEASAGTGKTYALEHIVKYLVTEKKIDIRNLLLVTFTEKAAGELKERIRKILEGNTEAARHLDEATICTIHSFCRELLDVYPFESGMQMASEIMSDDTALVENAVNNVLTNCMACGQWRDGFAVRMKEWDSKKDAEGLRSAVCTCVANMLQSGLSVDEWKKRTLVARFAAFREAIFEKVREIRSAHGGMNPGQLILANVNFTSRQKKNKEAFSHFDEWLKKLSDVQLEPDTVLKDGIPVLESLGGIGVSFGLYDKSGNKIIDQNGDVKFNKVYPEIETIKNISVTGSKLAVSTIETEVASLGYAEYKRLKKRSRTITFDDMVLETSRCVREAVADTNNAAKQAFLKAIRTRYRIALVDEFQDTDDKQWSIFRSLFSHAVNRVDGANPQQGCLIVVGDPKQAIYRFRGADIDTYLRARREITGGDDTKVFRLCEMYRSTEQMVEAFNKIFGVVSADDAGWFKGMHSLEGEIAYGEGVRFPKDDPPASVKEFRYPDGESAVELLESLPDGEAVAAKVVALPLVLENMAMEMKRLHENAFWMQEQPPKNRMDWRAMCVLGKSHADCEAAKKVLQRRGIPCRIYKEAGLFDSAESESVLALFDYLTMPRSNGNLAALLLTPFFRTPLCGIENRMLQENAAFDRLTDRWRSLIAKREWVRFFESALNDTELGRAHPEDPEFLRHRAGVRQIFDQLLERCGRARDLSVMADTLRCWRRDDSAAGETGSVRDKESEADAVQIMTIHAAKGLEFNAVFVPYGFSMMVSQQTPKEEKRVEGMEVRRLLYVALTRAKLKLYLPWSRRATETTYKAETALRSFLGNGIRALFGDDAATHVRGVAQLPPPNVQNPVASTAPVGPVQPPLPPHRGMKGWRFKWDSFSSLNHPAPQAVKSVDVKPQEDEVEDATVKQVSLVPKGALSGTVFHEVMETLCGNDGTGRKNGFEIGNKSFEEVVAETAYRKSPLLEIIRRRLSANGVVNRSGQTPDQTTAGALARMVWNALRAPLDFGNGSFRLCDIPLRDRRAEVGFVLGEKCLEDLGVQRDGALNGSIDLLFRRGDDYFIVDWKTNTLEDYGTASVEEEMNAAGYHLQHDIYTLAAEKWLGTKVKGVAYLFVRGGEFGSVPGVFIRTVTDEDRATFGASFAKRFEDSDNAESRIDEEDR